MDTTSMLASVPASKLALLEARVARVTLPSVDTEEEDISDGEDISGSDSDPADPEYLPKDMDKESSLASDSSDDEVVLTLLMQLSNSLCPYQASVTPGGFAVLVRSACRPSRVSLVNVARLNPGILVGVPNQALQFTGRIFCIESFNLTC
jgi:hypothetical protein